VVRSLTKFYDDKALVSLKQIAAKEKNPSIASVAISALGKFPDDQVETILSAALTRASYRNALATAAISAIQAQGNSAEAEAVMKTLKSDKQEFTTRDFGRALNSLASLVHDEKPDTDIHEQVRTYITDHLSDPKRSLRTASIQALATLKDPRSLPVLQTFVDSGNEKSSEYKAAESAIRKINSDRKQADEVQSLRKELMEIQKSIKELKKQQAADKKRSAPEKKENKK